MTTRQDLYEQAGNIGKQASELHGSLANLAWKFSQPNCQTAERQSRIDAMAAEYRALQAKRAELMQAWARA